MSAFMISTETMHRVVHAIDKHCTVFGLYSTEPTRNLDRIGEALFKMNERAVNVRYPDHEPQQAPAYGYRSRGGVKLVDQYQAIGCLIYQCSEGNVPDTDLYKELNRLHDRIAHEVASEATRAAKSPWDWPELP